MNTQTNAVAVILTETAYRLAQLMLPKDRIPTLSDIREGFGMVASFHRYFAPAYPKDDGTVEWPTGGKKGIMEMYFEQLDELTSTLLGLKDHTDGSDLRQIAFQVANEREKGIPVVPVVDEHTPWTAYAPLSETIAQKAYYTGARAIKIIREASKGSGLNSRSNMTMTDLQMLNDLTLQPLDEAPDPESLDHYEENSDSWTFGDELKRFKTGEVKLDHVELEMAENWRNAFRGWYTLCQNVPDSLGFLQDEIEYQKERAQEWLDTQKASNPIKGKPRVNRKAA
jgi:hypothetical protein